MLTEIDVSSFSALFPSFFHRRHTTCFRAAIVSSSFAIIRRRSRRYFSKSRFDERGIMALVWRALLAAFSVESPIKSSKFFARRSRLRARLIRRMCVDERNVTALKWRYRLERTRRGRNARGSSAAAEKPLPNHCDLSEHNEAQAVMLATSSAKATRNSPRFV